MLQKKLVIGMSTFIFSSIALGANAIQPAQTQQSAQTANAQANQEPSETTESVVPTGARLVAGETENEFYILDKDEPMPVKTADANATAQIKDKKPDTDHINATQNNLKDKNLASNEANQTNQITGSSTNLINNASVATPAQIIQNKQQAAGLAAMTTEAFEEVTASEAAKEKATQQKIAKDKVASSHHAKHKMASKKGHKLFRQAKNHSKHQMLSKRHMVKTNIATHTTSKHMARAGAVDQIQVVPHWTVHHHKLAAVKNTKHQANATRATPHKTVSKKSVVTKVKVALNEKHGSPVNDVASTPEIY
jgi:hypothetical protein